MVSIDVVSPARIRCHEIATPDIGGVIELLTNGFRRRPREHWVSVLKRLSEHPTPPGFPKYGYLLERENTPVGVILLIFSSIVINEQTTIRCNVCSWYVEPEFRSHAAMLVSYALRRKQVTYCNLTPSLHTLPILEAHGYRRYCSGWFAAIPALRVRSDDAVVKVVTPDVRPDEDLQPAEIELLLKHSDYGCISLTCSSSNRRYPFVFMPRRKFGVIPMAYLVYCRDREDFVRFARPLGRFLASRGYPLVLLDSNGSIPGLVGAYFDGHPKYFKGPNQPRLGDLAYSELSMFRVMGEGIWRSWRPESLRRHIAGKTWAHSK